MGCAAQAVQEGIRPANKRIKLLCPAGIHVPGQALLATMWFSELANTNMVFSVPRVNEQRFDLLVICWVVLAYIFIEMAHVIMNQTGHTPPASSAEDASDEHVLVLATLVVDKFTPRHDTTFAFPAVGAK